MTQTFPSHRDGPDNALSPAQSLAQLDLDDLAQLCAQELHRLLAARSRAADSHEGAALELFRRATGGSAPAWAHIFQQYTLPLTAWLTQFAEAGLVIEWLGVPAIVDAALMHLSQTLTPDKLLKLPDHRALLRYLKMTLGSVVLAAQRAQGSPPALTTEAGPPSIPPLFERCDWQTSPSQQALWQAILAELKSDDLRLVASLSFVQAQSPGAISSQFSARFPTVENVYHCQRTILDRIRHNPAILDLLARMDRGDPTRAEGSRGTDCRQPWYEALTTRETGGDNGRTCQHALPYRYHLPLHPMHEGALIARRALRRRPWPRNGPITPTTSRCRRGAAR